MSAAAAAAGEDVLELRTAATRSDDTGKQSSRKQVLCGLIAWGIGALYAVTDEIHQMFSEGRSCEFRDICIDAGGVLFGVLIIHLIWRARRNRHPGR